MGSAQSYLPAATLVVAGAAAYGYSQTNKPAAVAPRQFPSSSAPSSKKQKQKKKAGAGTTSAQEDASTDPSAVSLPPTVPGDFNAPTPTPASPPSESADNVAAPKPKKKKKGKKASPVPVDAQSESSATAPESSAVRKPKKASAKQPALDDDGWTRVDTKKKVKDGAKTAASAGTGAAGQSLEISTSDAGITTSVTGNSSPVTERTEDESSALADSAVSENRRTLAERLLPKARKTGVEDLLEEPDYPQLSRVMRIKPRPDEQPAAGFSWGDYEDVDNRGTANDADGEDDGGWGVVKGRGRPKPTKAASQQVPAQQTDPESLTKKQRQHAARREAQKAAKAEAETERLATLAKHKRELEKAKIAEQTKASKKTPSGGMSAYVDENGKLVWS